MAQRQPTIADVAERAGVGVSTVSRVLNDGQVSGHARERVMAAISDLAYRPRASARALASGSTGMVGLVIPFFTHPSAVERVRGVMAAMEETPFDLIVCDVGDPGQRDAYLGRRAPVNRSDGLLIVSLAPHDDEVDALLARARPWCSSTRSTRGCRAWSSTTSTAASWRPATCSSSATSGSRSSATRATRATGSCRAACAARAIAARWPRRASRCATSCSGRARTGARSRTG